jgi:hypothetical protein
MRSHIPTERHWTRDLADEQTAASFALAFGERRYGMFNVFADEAGRSMGRGFRARPVRFQQGRQRTPACGSVAFDNLVIHCKASGDRRA